MRNNNISPVLLSQVARPAGGLYFTQYYTTEVIHMEMGSLWHSTGHAVGQSMVTEVCPGGRQLSPIAIPEGSEQAV